MNNDRKTQHRCAHHDEVAAPKLPTRENHMFIIVRAGLALAAPLIVLALACAGCDGGREGDRCNPDLSHNDCNDGLTCVVPATCVENYCCPTPASASTNAYCNGLACPMTSSGADDSDAASDAAANAD